MGMCSTLVFLFSTIFLLCKLCIEIFTQYTGYRTEDENLECFLAAVLANYTCR